MADEFVVARVAVPEGVNLRGEVYADPDRMLGTTEIARLLGLSPSSWRTYVMRGEAPRADDASNPFRPLWKLSTVREYRLSRRRRASKKRG